MSTITLSREATHGSFKAKTRFIQALKFGMRDQEGWVVLTDSQQEALDMIASKIGRILTGNPNEPDHWIDIGGYADLIIEELAMDKAAGL